MAPGWRRLVEVASTPPYRWYLLGQVADTLGVWMQRLAIGWLVWELTHSAGWLGAATFIKFAPTIALGLVGGWLADRFPRGLIVISVQALAVVKTGLIALLLALGALNLPVLLLLELLIGIGIALSQAASRALVVEMVPADRLPSAIALSSIVFNISSLIGPVIAGAIMVAIDVVACMWIITALFATNLAAYVSIARRISRPSASQGEPMLRAISSALRHAIGHDGIGPLLALHLAFTLSARPLIELLPAFAGGVLGGGVGDVTMLTSAVGIGAAAAGLYLGTRRQGGLCLLVVYAMLGLGIAMLAFAEAPTLLVATPLAVFVGAGMTIRGAGIETLIQLASSDQLRGRVLSFYGMLLNGGVACGSVMMGLLADAIGLRLAIVVMALGALGVWAWVHPRRARMTAALEPHNPPQV
ncbi:MAG: MFS transporter [Alphaproteobacteria bacterium]|nr:MFS transporter [Alphaproteobacteria bacterium]